MWYLINLRSSVASGLHPTKSKAWVFRIRHPALVLSSRSLEKLCGSESTEVPPPDHTQLSHHRAHPSCWEQVPSGVVAGAPLGWDALSSHTQTSG